MINSDPLLRVHLIAQHAAGGRTFRLVGIVGGIQKSCVLLESTILLCARSHACRVCNDSIRNIPHVELGVIHALPAVEMDDVRVMEVSTPAPTDGLPF